MKFDIEKSQDGLSAIILVHSESLDASNVKAFKAALQPALAAHQNIILDMSELSFVDSSGLGALLSCLRTMSNKNGQLKLCSMAKPVKALFELVRMHRIFSIYNDRAAASCAL